MQTVRAFVAIKVADPIKEKLLATIERLKGAGADVKWVNRDNIHLTLKFLGNISKANVVTLSGFLKENAKAVKPFEVNVKDVGVFPPKGAPRVIWAGCSNEEILGTLASSIEASCEKIGVPKEDRKFSAHITIGRVKSPQNIEALKPLITELSSSGFGAQSVNSFELFESKLQRDGPIYTILESYQLGEN